MHTSRYFVNRDIRSDKVCIQSELLVIEFGLDSYLIISSGFGLLVHRLCGVKFPWLMRRRDS